VNSSRAILYASSGFADFADADAAAGIDPRQRHVALGQHALDAGLGHVERARQVGVGHAGALEFVLQGLDEIDGGAHGGSGQAEGIERRYRRV
jgi:hypothetical protein